MRCACNGTHEAAETRLVSAHQQMTRKGAACGGSSPRQTRTHAYTAPQPVGHTLRERNPLNNKSLRSDRGRAALDVRVDCDIDQNKYRKDVPSPEKVPATNNYKVI